MTHGRNPGYIKGDYWMNCQVCGFNYRRSQMRERWDGLWTCHKDWEPRHPQDFLVGVPDNQAVSVARPDDVDFTNSTTLTADAASGATSVSVASISGIDQYSSVGIELDDGTVHWDQVTESPDDVADFTSSWDFTSGWTISVAGVTIDDSNSFTSGFGKGIYATLGLVAGNTYEVTVTADVNFQIKLGTAGEVVLTNSGTATFTASNIGGMGDFFIRNTTAGGTVNVSDISLDILNVKIFRGLFGPASSGNTVYVRGSSFITTAVTVNDL